MANAHIRVFWANGRDGLYGEARPIVVDGVRGAEVYVLPEQSSSADGLLRDAILYLTCVHETGHALGLQHTAVFADIMYSFQYRRRYRGVLRPLPPPVERAGGYTETRGNVGGRSEAIAGTVEVKARAPGPQPIVIVVRRFRWAGYDTSNVIAKSLG